MNDTRLLGVDSSIMIIIFCFQLSSVIFDNFVLPVIIITMYLFMLMSN